MDLRIGRGGRRYERFTGRVGGDPPSGNLRGKERLASVVARLHRSPAVVADRLGDLTLLRPQVVAELTLHPADRVGHERRHRLRFELPCGSLPRRQDGRSHTTPALRDGPQMPWHHFGHQHFLLRCQIQFAEDRLDD